MITTIKFRAKKELKRILFEENEEYFIVSTKIAFDDELINIVKYWIPYIKIISPLYLQEKFTNILEDYLITTHPRNNKCNTS